MRILIAAPLKRKVTAEITAARPRMVFDLASRLVARGHKVSLLGTGNSRVEGAKLLPVIPKGVVEMGPFENEFVARCAFLAKQAKMLEKIGAQFDIIHNHARPEFFNLFAGEKLKTPMLTTLHGVMEKENDEIFSMFSKLNLVCISKAAAKLAKKTKVKKVIYNGVDTDLYKFEAKKDDYLLWVGRLSRTKDKQGRFLDAKGVRWAIKLALAAGSRLKMVGNVEDMEFFEKDVKPYLASKITAKTNPSKSGTISCDPPVLAMPKALRAGRRKLSQIEWIGPLSSEQPLSKKQVAGLMAKARAFLMPVNWQEPFGLVMAESMSCGAPVIGFDRGSVRELVKNGKTGFVVPPSQGLTGLKNALAKINVIKPKDCRAHILANFSLEKMVENYEKTYQEVVKNRK